MNKDSFGYLQKFVKKNYGYPELYLGDIGYKQYIAFINLTSKSIITHFNQFSIIQFIINESNLFEENFFMKTKDFLSLNNIHAIKAISDNEVAVFDNDDAQQIMEKYSALPQAGDVKNRDIKFYSSIIQHINSIKWEREEVEFRAYTFNRLFKKHVNKVMMSEKGKYMNFRIQCNDYVIDHTMVKQLHIVNGLK